MHPVLRLQTLARRRVPDSVSGGHPQDPWQRERAIRIILPVDTHSLIQPEGRHDRVLYNGGDVYNFARGHGLRIN